MAAAEETPRKAPWFCTILLAASVFAVSSAAVAFTFIKEVPPITLASWRLQLTAVITATAGAVQWRGLSKEHRAQFRRDLHLTTLSGLALTLHFGTWVWSLQATSLAHSLLLVSTSPVINVGVALLLRHAISAGEVAGSLMALAGCGVLAAGAVAGKEKAVTLWGDLAAFAAAVCIVVHWQIGKKLRSYQPVFVYSGPLTVMAATLLTITGLLAESRSMFGAPEERHGAFGWLLSRHYAPFVVYLGTVPGIVGHQGFNTVLKYLTPLLVSLAVQLEPVLGPALGWALGVAAAPGLFTWIGGSIVLLATLGATLATARRQQQEEAAAAEADSRLLLKKKSMRLPSSSADDDAGYAAVNAEAAAPRRSRQGGHGGDGGSSSAQEGDMDVIVSERQQLLPASSQLSHHVKPHAGAHHEIELPDIHSEQR